MTPPTDRPSVLIVPVRPGRGPKGLVLPLLVLLVATAGIVARCGTSDWRGFSQEFQTRLGSLFGPKEKEKTPTLVAQAEPPKIAEPEKTLEAVAEKPISDAPTPAAAPVPSPWDDIQKSAEKAKAEREEAEKLKAKAAEELANTPPPAPIRRGRALDPAQIAEIQKQMQARMEAMLGDQDFPMRGFDDMMRRQEAQMRQFDDMFRRQAEAHRQFAQRFARNGPRGFGNVPPGLRNFAVPPPPLPGVDQPEEPKVHEESGEEVRDGVKTIWRRRVIIMGGR